jgi:hypothetical protein
MATVQMRKNPRSAMSLLNPELKRLKGKRRIARISDSKISKRLESRRPA